MNKLVLKKVIEKIENEKCPAHDQRASFKVFEGGIVMGDYCCATFYKTLTKRIEEELNRQMLLL